MLNIFFFKKLQGHESDCKAERRSSLKKVTDLCLASTLQHVTTVISLLAVQMRYLEYLLHFSHTHTADELYTTGFFILTRCVTHFSQATVSWLVVFHGPTVTKIASLTISNCIIYPRQSVLHYTDRRLWLTLSKLTIYQAHTHTHMST